MNPDATFRFIVHSDTSDPNYGEYTLYYKTPTILSYASGTDTETYAQPLTLQIADIREVFKSTDPNFGRAVTLSDVSETEVTTYDGTYIYDPGAEGGDGQESIHFLGHSSEHINALGFTFHPDTYTSQLKYQTEGGGSIDVSSRSDLWGAIVINDIHKVSSGIKLWIGFRNTNYDDVQIFPPTGELYAVIKKVNLVREIDETQSVEVYPYNKTKSSSEYSDPSSVWYLDGNISSSNVTIQTVSSTTNDLSVFYSDQPNINDFTNYALYKSSLRHPLCSGVE